MNATLENISNRLSNIEISLQEIKSGSVKIEWVSSEQLKNILGYGSKSTFDRWVKEGWLSYSQLTENSKRFYYLPDIIKKFNLNQIKSIDKRI